MNFYHVLNPYAGLHGALQPGVVMADEAMCISVAQISSMR